MKRTNLIIINYQYEIPPFMQTMLHYADEVFDKVYCVFPVAQKKPDIRGYSKKIRFIGVPREMAFRRILKLPVFAAEKEAREQIIRAITCSVPLINLAKIMAVHRLWADCFESVVSRVLKKEQLNRKNTVILSAWFSAEAIAGAGLKRKYPEMRFVSLAHSFEIDKFKNAYIAYDYTVKKHQYCDHIFFVSEMMRKQYYRDFKELIPEKEWSKTAVMHLGSRKHYPDRFVPASTDGILRLLSVSDVIPVKRIDRIIDSLAVWDGLKM